MMKIDWNEAPEGYPLWLEDIRQKNLSRSCWAREGKGEYEFPGGGFWSYSVEGFQYRVHRRPEPWTGEGLPPAGTVCEFMKHNSPPAPEGKWTIGEIRYVSDFTVIISGDKCEHVHHPRACSFRPIRTPEQIAAEDRAKAIEEMRALVQRKEPPFDHWLELSVAGELYDAGYRKQVTECQFPQMCSTRCECGVKS